MSEVGPQVGGTHYDDLAIHPWELTVSYDLGGNEHSIVKYVTRWRTAAGLKDLRKCLQFSEKILLDIKKIWLCRGLAKPRPLHISPEVYCIENRLGLYETVVVNHVCQWELHGDESAIRIVRDTILEMIHVERLAQGLRPGE